MRVATSSGRTARQAVSKSNPGASRVISSPSASVPAGAWPGAASTTTIVSTAAPEARMAARVYEGELAPNSVKSYDLESRDGRRVQVKARIVGPNTGAGAIFSAFRSFDFDVAVLIAFDHTTYDVLWAREVPAADIETAGSFSAHVNGHRIRITAGKYLGTDVTPRFKAMLSA
ncbi:hypothetical protein AB0M83_17645 [Amycolatopsis sp. NPDC051106]|uniref:hypothetical protein n=1 Tax=unclassified Amycolatopsis TaxID=2618356 RepID=UPI00343DA90B